MPAAKKPTYRDVRTHAVIKLWNYSQRTADLVEAFKALDFEDNKPAELTDLLTGETTISTLTDAYPHFLGIKFHSR